MIGDDVVVTVLDVRGDVVRVGIKAPRSVQVHREEVYRELQNANREAASPSDVAVEALTQLLRPNAGESGAGESGAGGSAAGELAEPPAGQPPAGQPAE